MKLVAKDIGITWLAFCIAIALLCGVLTLSVWDILDAPKFGKFLIALDMAVSFLALFSTLVTVSKSRKSDVGNLWRFGLAERPDEDGLVAIWQWSRATMCAWGTHIFVFCSLVLYMRTLHK